MRAPLPASAFLLLCALGFAPGADDAARIAELDAYWAEVSRCVGEGDFEGYKATCHAEGVLVTGSKQTSYPLSQALERWQPEFVETKEGKTEASVEFRFAGRLGDAATAHETGIFLYSNAPAGGEAKREYIHFEALLVKREAGWKILMEYQKSAATRAEWDALAPAIHGYPQGVREVAIESSRDGAQQPALFYLPPGEERVPLLVALHTWSSDWKSPYKLPLAEGCIERGWAFLHPDFRGPNRTPQACGSELAVADIRDAVAWALRENPNIDPSRVYLAGASGGGHMALLMAGRAPELWAGVSAWVPITDCAAWHAECIESGRKYATDLELSCGGKPGESAEIDREYRVRSPLTWLEHAKGIPVGINAGIRDGHEGSVPISHSLHAFNVLAAPGAKISGEAIAQFTATPSVPEILAKDPIEPAEGFGDKQPLWRRKSGLAEIAIFDGGHEMIPGAIFEFLSGKSRP